MSKITIVNFCGECIYQHNGACIHADALFNNSVNWNDMPDWCPLPNLPEKLLVGDDGERMANLQQKAKEMGFEPKMGSLALGWDSCLEAILGRKVE